MHRIFLFSLVLIFPHISWGFWPKEYPRISLHRWLELDLTDHTTIGGGGGRWRHDFENITKGLLTILDQGQTFVVSSQITGLGIECNASYPIRWVSKAQEDSDYYSFYTRVRYLRTNPDVFNPRSNTFSAHLDLFGEQSGISGNYSCMSVQNNEVVKSIYVYWQGTNPSNLVLSGKTLEVQSKDGHYVILPCRVSRPDVTVDLYREVNADWVSIKSPYIRFSPKIGFRINLYQFNGGYGRFKCAVSDDETEALIVNVKKGVKDPTSEFNNTLDGNATIYFNRSSQEIICCSSSGKPPKLHTMFCLENFSCELRKYQLHAIANNGRRSATKGCTVERVYTKDAGLLRCSGDGIDVVRNFYTNLPSKINNQTASLYFNWDEIPPETMVSISGTFRNVVYDGQNITFSCDSGFNYFAEGMQWAIRWRNGSLNFFPTLYSQSQFTPGVLDVYENSLTSSSLRVHVSRDITEILCFVPVWNDTRWVNKTMQLDVQEAMPPNFAQPEPVELQWKLNSTEQTISCAVKGTPLPAIRWKKNNKSLIHENNLVLKRQNGTVILLIHRVSHDVQGLYSCIATNYAGTAEKAFQVFVTQPSTGLGGVAITILILFILTLLTGIGFLGWKMQIQRRVIDHLAGIVFRDVGSNSTSGNNPQSVGTTGENVNVRGNSDRNPFPSSIS